MHNDLPIWVSYLQAFSTPVLAFAGLMIAGGQLLLARIRLQHDLYDRRLRVFEAAKKLLIMIFQMGNVTNDAIYEYVRGTSEAAFLLDDDTATYLESLRKEAVKLAYLNNQLNRDDIAEDKRGKFADDEAKLLEWFLKQLDVLIAKFKPSLRLKFRWRDALRPA